MVLFHLNKKLKEIYFTYKDHPDPPVPLKTIKEFLEGEGIFLGDEVENKDN